MQLQRTKAVYADGRELEADVGPRTQVDFERNFGMSYVDVFGPARVRVRMEHLYHIAWRALVNAGLEPEEDFDVWLGQIVDVDPNVNVATGSGATEEGAARAAGTAHPTRTARRPVTSST